MLRYDSPVQLIHRQVMEDIEVGGLRLRQGETILTLLGAANRDPARFPEPDRFDLGRQGKDHLAFAWGLHFCLGARLARMEAQLILAGLPGKEHGPHAAAPGLDGQDDPHCRLQLIAAQGVLGINGERKGLDFADGGPDGPPGQIHVRCYHVTLTPGLFSKTKVFVPELT